MTKEQVNIRDQINIKNRSFYNTLCFFFIICMMIIGYAALSIVNFAIEDHFEQPIASSFFFSMWGPEYAKSASWLFVASLVAIPLAIFQKHLSYINNPLYQTNFRRRLLGSSLVIGFITAFFYILIVIYSYFSGRSDPVGLYRIASTLMTIFIGLLFLGFEKRLSPCLSRVNYFAIFSGFLAIFVVAGFSLTFKYAPPTKMRMIRADLEKVKAIEDVAGRLKSYFARSGSLPADKRTALLAYDGVSGEYTMAKFKHVKYQRLSDSKFKLCSSFDTSYEDARRESPSRNRFYKIGEHCLIFNLIKKKSKTEISVVNNNNIRVNLSSGIY